MKEVEVDDKWENEGGNGSSRGELEALREERDLLRAAMAEHADLEVNTQDLDTEIDMDWIKENGREIKTAIDAMPNLSAKLDELAQNQMVIVSLLMRLYDISLAQLTVAGQATMVEGPDGKPVKVFDGSAMADQIYEAHAKGGTFGPTIFVPTLAETENDDVQQDG